jgi:hypothetical protein
MRRRVSLTILNRFQITVENKFRLINIPKGITCYNSGQGGSYSKGYLANQLLQGGLTKGTLIESLNPYIDENIKLKREGKERE